MTCSAKQSTLLITVVFRLVLENAVMPRITDRLLSLFPNSNLKHSPISNAKIIIIIKDSTAKNSCKKKI